MGIYDWRIGVEVVGCGGYSVIYGICWSVGVLWGVGLVCSLVSLVIYPLIVYIYMHFNTINLYYPYFLYNHHPPHPPQPTKHHRQPQQ
jgi:hypothetical protein